MNNHYKSKLVINRFNRKVWFYDMDNRTLVQKQSHKIFCGQDIYDLVIEEKLHKLETTYSRIIDDKILGKEEIRLTREELFLIKKFLLVDSIRQMYADGVFVEYFNGFEKSARQYFNFIEINSMIDPRDKMFLNELKKYNHKYLSEMDIPDEDKFRVSLEFILDNDIFNLYMTECPLDIIAWAAAMTESYITFWDSCDTEEFILTDINMMSEYDMCHTIFGGLNTEKFSFLISKIKTKEASLYSNLIKTTSVMYENYNIFNLSNTRCIVCINPFFKLYSDRILEHFNPNYKMPKPDIWPGVTIHHLSAYEIPKNEYEINFMCHTPNDIFYYKPYKLTFDETLALNMQFLNESKQFIGFVNKDKVRSTFEYANIALAAYDASVKSDGKTNPLAALEEWTHSMMNNKYYPIMNELFQKGDELSFNPFDLLDKTTYLSQIGMKTNFYMYEYFIKKLKNNPNLNLAPFEFLKKLGITDYISFFERELKFARDNNKRIINDLYNNKL